GETIAIYRGKLYVLTADKGLKYGDYDRAREDPSLMTQLWRKQYIHHNDEEAKKRWDAGQFKIIRKPPEVLLAMMRLVYDNDHQAKDLTGPEYQRWVPADKESGWDADKDRKSFRGEGGEQTGWLRYRHVLRGQSNDSVEPELITAFLGYNTFVPPGHKRAGQ